MFANAWLIRGFARTMPQLTQALDEILTSRVVDQTGLTGAFDFHVEWGQRGDTPRDPSVQTPDSIATLVTAFRERLGLKLARTRAAIDVLVIDHIERPDAD